MLKLQSHLCILDYITSRFKIYHFVKMKNAVCGLHMIMRRCEWEDRMEIDFIVLR